LKNSRLRCATFLINFNIFLFFTADKKPVEKSIKEQIDREYKEIDECKQIGITKKNDKDKIKKMSAEYSPIGSDGMIIPYEQRKENNEKFTSMPNKSIACNSTDALHKSSRKIHEGIPIMARSVFFYLISTVYF